MPVSPRTLESRPGLRPVAEDELELTLLMPCLDEARTVGACVAQARGYLEEHGIAGEVLVVDNGSRDGSHLIASACGARVVPVSERGYGAALAAGIAEARGRYVVMGDSDGSYDWSRVGPVLHRLRAGDELVMGNRFQGGIRAGAMPFLHRYLGNPVLSVLGRRLFGSPCGDFYCGQRGFSRAAVMSLDLRARGMEFALEMLVKATLFGLRVSEIPVTLSPDGRGRRSHLSTWRDGWRSLRLYLLCSPRWLFLYPGLVMLLAGCGTGAWLLGGAGATPGLELHALLGCASAACAGFQLTLLGLLAKMQATAAGLHPPSRALERLVGVLRLEHGLVAGGLLVLAGLAGSAWAAAGWTAGGALDPLATLRSAIPWACLLVLGCQMVGASFYYGLLAARWQVGSPAEDEVWSRREAA